MITWLISAVQNRMGKCIVTEVSKINSNHPLSHHQMVIRGGYTSRHQIGIREGESSSNNWKQYGKRKLRVFFFCQSRRYPDPKGRKNKMFTVPFLLFAPPIISQAGQRGVDIVKGTVCRCWKKCYFTDLSN